MAEEHAEVKSLVPFSIAWLIYVVAIALAALLLFPKIQVLQHSDYRTFYVAGLLVRASPSHLYDLEEYRRIQGSLVGAENAGLPYIQPPYEALILEPFSLVPYQTAYYLMMAFNLVLLWPCVLLARDAFSTYVDPWQPRPGLIFILVFSAFLGDHPAAGIRTIVVHLLRSMARIAEQKKLHGRTRFVVRTL